MAKTTDKPEETAEAPKSAKPTLESLQAEVQELKVALVLIAETARRLTPSWTRQYLMLKDQLAERGLEDVLAEGKRLFPAVPKDLENAPKG